MSTFQTWLESVQQAGVKMGLERVQRALELVGDPQRSAPSLLVGGTNGKGSTVTYAAALLAAAGHNIGSTTSPHLVDYRERFVVDGRIITPEELESVGSALHARLANEPGLEELTFFELGTLVAAAWFKERKVDASVWEVGMGGEFDASRASEPCVLALTNVDLDHCAFLGEDVEAIARTKARAVPAGGIVVTTETRPDRLDPIREEVAAAGARLIAAGEDFRWRFDDGLSFEYGGLRLDQVQLAMRGAHQGQNAACAIAAVAAFCAESGIRPPSPWEAAEAVGRARLPGRLERLRAGPGAPAFVLDGAHNPAGARALGVALTGMRRPPERVWLFASMADKDRAPLIEAVLPHVDRVVCARGTTSDRFESPEVLAAEVTAAGGTSEISGTTEEATNHLKNRLSIRDEVLVAGSLYAVGDVRRALGFVPK